MMPRSHNVSFEETKIPASEDAGYSDGLRGAPGMWLAREAPGQFDFA